MSSYCDVAPGHPWHGPYHDSEYGFPVSDDRVLFERVCVRVIDALLTLRRAGLAVPLAINAPATTLSEMRSVEFLLDRIRAAELPPSLVRVELTEDQPIRDLDVLRASLLRLENLEQAHADALRAGYLDDVLAFAKGRALERLRAFDLAAASYRLAARGEGPLAGPALRDAALCDVFAEAAAIVPTGALEGTVADPEAILDAHELRLGLLEAVRAEAGASHYAAILAEDRRPALGEPRRGDGPSYDSR